MVRPLTQSRRVSGDWEDILLRSLATSCHRKPLQLDELEGPPIGQERWSTGHMTEDDEKWTASMILIT